MRNQSSSKKTRWSGLLLVALIAALLTGCNASSNQTDMSEMNLAPLENMPEEVQRSPVSVQQAYQFAAANPDVLNQIPCYCGCGAVGHKSNYDCYVSGQNSDESLAFDSHALGCSICVDITQDAMRFIQQGKSVAEIRNTIDSTYSQYGPSNMP